MTLSSITQWVSQASSSVARATSHAQRLGQLAQAALQLHYLRHGYFLRAGQLLAGLRHLRHLPAVIVQGSNDPLCPAVSAETLHHHWPEATWMPLRNAGHGPADPAIARALRKGVAWVTAAVESEVSGS